MLTFLAVLLVFFVLPIFLLFAFHHWRAMRFRRKFLRTAVRVGDAEFLAGLSGRPGGELEEIALDLRTLLAKCCRLPRQCIRPDSALGDLFFASGCNPVGVDAAAIVCRMEDFSWYGGLAARLDAIPYPDEDDTVDKFVGDVLAVCRTEMGVSPDRR